MVLKTGMHMKLKYIIWAGLATALIGATSIVLQKKTKKGGHQKPPKGAPQLKIENPGSQDEFPKPPMESEVG